MEKNNRDFKGVWIPKEIWLTDKLTLQEKVFWVEINSLDNKDGCFASNKYFSEFFNLSQTRVSEVINSLVKKNWITSKFVYKDNSKEINKRILHSITPLRETGIPPSGNCKDNNTLYNNKDKEIISNIAIAKQNKIVKKDYSSIEDNKISTNGVEINKENITSTERSENIVKQSAKQVKKWEDFTMEEKQKKRDSYKFKDEQIGELFKFQNGRFDPEEFEKCYSINNI